MHTINSCYNHSPFLVAVLAREIGIYFNQLILPPVPVLRPCCIAKEIPSYLPVLSIWILVL